MSNNFNKLIKNKRCKKIFNIFIMLFLFIFFHTYDTYRNRFLDIAYLKIKEFERSYSKSFFYNFFSETFIYQTKKFRETNAEDIILDHFLFNNNDHPDVSVIILAYNQANCFYKALRSVQNQSLKNIEIIVIDDCSLDNTTEVMEKYMKEDNRIKYLKNQSNKGKIASRSEGIKIAKGNYILLIDGDDALSHKNILYNSFSIAKIGNLDIVEFRYGFYKRQNFVKLNFNLKNIKNYNRRIIFQPELTFKFLDLDENDSDNGFTNRAIWGKLIKKDLFNKVIDFIGPKYTEDYISDYEDTIMSISLFYIANSYYYINELGYYYSKGECENHFPFLEHKKCIPLKIEINKELDSIKYLNFLLDISKGSEIESKLLYKELMSINHCKKLDKINKNFSYVYSILNRINNSNYYTKKQRQKITKIKDKLMKKEYSINNRNNLKLS